MVKFSRCYGFVFGLCLLLTVLFVAGNVSAIGVDQDDISASLAQISVSSASNLYAYEVNFDYTGSYSSPTFTGFLGSGTSTGSSARNGVLSVYESRLDSSQTGVSGSGELFNISHSGDLELRYVLFVYANGDEEYVYYNNSASPDGTSSGVISGGTGPTSAQPNITVTPILTPAQIKLSAEPSELSVASIIGQRTIRTFNITNNGDESITLQIRINNLNFVVAPAEITLGPKEQKLVIVEVAPFDKGLLTGTIEFLYRDESVFEVPIVLNVRSENFLFDTSLAVSDRDRLLSPGQPLVAQIDLKEVGQNDKIDIVATYYIKDYAGTIYLQESETFFVLNEKSYVKRFPTDSLPPGKYILGVEIVYPGAFATSSAHFEVQRPFSFKGSAQSILILIVAGAAAVVLIVLFFTVVRRPRLRRHR